MKSIASRAKGAAVTLFLVASAPTAWSLQVVTGQIASVDLNGGFSDRGLCIAMSPTLPEAQYACLYKSNNLYKEFNAMLMAAFAAGKSCSLWLDQKGDGGYWVLNIARCYP